MRTLGARGPHAPASQWANSQWFPDACIISHQRCRWRARRWRQRPARRRRSRWRSCLPRQISTPRSASCVRCLRRRTPLAASPRSECYVMSAVLAVMTRQQPTSSCNRFKSHTSQTTAPPASCAPAARRGPTSWRRSCRSWATRRPSSTPQRRLLSSRWAPQAAAQRQELCKALQKVQDGPEALHCGTTTDHGVTSILLRHRPWGASPQPSSTTWATA